MDEKDTRWNIIDITTRQRERIGSALESVRRLTDLLSDDSIPNPKVRSSVRDELGWLQEYLKYAYDDNLAVELTVNG